MYCAGCRKVADYFEKRAIFLIFWVCFLGNGKLNSKFLFEELF
ncbi:hypothetical protein LEP1GSC103_0818 [Leptospira borgpetersenii serovar Javanica str. UI 09931]|uniref:Uncharacterized protein n=5 Tax=Leptospira borgpetersenii TaxID=174 RepID=M3GSB1_LEPBO|nr:hypothetical protein LBBP_04085 [Leptospira borgpetersenii serovar Ballum]EKP11590.1 hypothetical protein LEP1GSC128_1150 [Leptospira borgpetersenii str. 200801926]EKQ91522.1 hypothetical protein LEP1GSC101_1019 [Leptospira borgpetersenii str. UI 09149]EKR00965.1 hypothetical protein LEP1GSC121_1567 [Leptospira borgpetersenii serovar Castellonis str. 200801910]EMF97713.1 hypothetical protein LEP1GSC123_1157 [Leptospira borgpetersenii str. 200701203]EMK11853.1 hypothetical protein LEP1GSC066